MTLEEIIKVRKIVPKLIKIEDNCDIPNWHIEKKENLRFIATIMVYERWKLAAEEKVTKETMINLCAGCFGHNRNLWGCSADFPIDPDSPQFPRENQDYCPVDKFCHSLVKEEEFEGPPLDKIDLDLAWSQVEDEAKRAGIVVPPR